MAWWRRSLSVRRHLSSAWASLGPSVPLQTSVAPLASHSSHCRCSLGAFGCEAAHDAYLADQAEPQPQPEQKPKMDKPLAPPGLSRTFYKRQLPSPPSIEFASAKGKQLFAEAMLAGTMEGFFKLIEQFRTQDEPAYCGLASLAMVLNTLSIDPRRTWKGPWRWFHEEMLDCCHPLSKVREEGITLDQAACLARCNGSRVEMYLHGDVSVEQFRAMVHEACASGSQHIIVSYSRKEFLQTGDGHFSPVGGYSEATDMVLILDTARFKYPPHWVPLEMLYNAMARQDPTTGRPRGFLRLGTHPRLDSVLFTIDVRDPVWREAHQYVEGQLLGVVRAAAAAPGADAASVLRAAAAAAPLRALRQFIAVRTAGSSCNGGVCTQQGAIELFLRELHGMPLFAAVAAAVSQEPDSAAAAAPPAHSSQQQQQQQMSAASAAAAGAPPPQPDGTGPPEQQQQQQQHCSAASSSHAVAASSSAAPAVSEDVTAERVCMLLMMAPRDVWQEGLRNEQLRNEVLNMLDTSMHKVVGIEAEYLQGQFLELQALERAAEQEVPEGASCSLLREEERREEERGQAQRGGGGAQQGADGQREEVQAPAEQRTRRQQAVAAAAAS